MADYAQRIATEWHQRAGELATWVLARLTDPQKGDATNYEPGDLLQFHQNAPGHKNGSRLVVEEGMKPPVEFASRFEVYRPAQLSLGIGDRVRLTVVGCEPGQRMARACCMMVRKS
jgi:hypothetical protein